MTRQSLEQDLKDLEAKFGEITNVKTEAEAKAKEAEADIYRLQGEYRKVQALLAELPKFETEVETDLPEVENALHEVGPLIDNLEAKEKVEPDATS